MFRSFTRKRISVVTIAMTIVMTFSLFFHVKYSHAVPLTEASIRLDRIGAGEVTGSNYYILVVAKIASTATEASVKVTFPTSSAFTVDSTASNITVTSSGIPSTYQGETLTAWPGIGSAASAVSGGAVTVASSDLTPGTQYGFFITAGITNPSNGNAGNHVVTIATQTSAPAVIDTTDVTVDIATTDDDEVVVTATVPTSFNFDVQSNTIALGTQSTGSIDTGNTTIDIDSNANNGWIAWIRSEGAAATLASASSGDSIAPSGSATDGSVTTVSAGSEYYQVDVSGSQGGTSTGSLTISAEYDGNGTTTGGSLSTTYQQMAQSTGQALNDTLTVTVLVAISALTEAATDYTDTIQMVGAGNF